MDQEVWIAKAEYADGTTIEKSFAYKEDGNYSAECQRQYEIECWLIEEHDGCTWYSVDYERVSYEEA